MAISERYGEAPKRVILDYCVTGIEGVAELSPTILKNHRGKLAQIADRIRAREFEPRNDTFHQCIARKYWGSDDED